MITSKNNSIQQVDSVEPINTTPVDTVETYDLNPLSEMYKAIKRILSKLKEDPEDDNSEPLFKTIKLDKGQFDRIVSSKDNTESDCVFPAVFIHFTNVRYLVQQQRIGEGRATLRIRFILNIINGDYNDLELKCFEVFQRINQAIQDGKSEEEALNERVNLTYFDMPTTANMLQAYWVDYEVWFKEMSAFKYRKWVQKYVVMPPFTNKSDAPNHNPDGSQDYTSPTYNDSTKIEPSVEDDTDNPGGDETGGETETT